MIIIRYMGDRWVSSNLMRSTYVWLPLTLSGTTATLVNPSPPPSAPPFFFAKADSYHQNNQVNWVLSPNGNAGWSPGPSETTYEAEASSNTLASGMFTSSFP